MAWLGWLAGWWLSTGGVAWALTRRRQLPRGRPANPRRGADVARRRGVCVLVDAADPEHDHPPHARVPADHAHACQALGRGGRGGTSGCGGAVTGSGGPEAAQRRSSGEAAAGCASMHVHAVHTWCMRCTCGGRMRTSPAQRPSAATKAVRLPSSRRRGPPKIGPTIATRARSAIPSAASRSPSDPHPRRQRPASPGHRRRCSVASARLAT